LPFPLSFIGSIELSLTRASALPPQFHRVNISVTQERFHSAPSEFLRVELLFSIAYDSGTKNIIRSSKPVYKVPNYVAESFPKCQLHQIMTISQIQFMAILWLRQILLPMSKGLQISDYKVALHLHTTENIR
jgi:hypothetical protein